MTPRCWFCNAEIDPIDALAKGFIEPREAARGGPLYRYRCPECKREVLIERNARGRILARPRHLTPVVDRLIALFDPDFAVEVAAMRRWWQRNPGIAEWFHHEYVKWIDEWLDGKTTEDPRGERPRDHMPPPHGAHRRRERAAPPRPPPPPRPQAAPGDPWDVLGLPRGAGKDEVVKAFRKLAMEHHPDRHATAGPAAQEAATQRFIVILEAYERLRAVAG